MTRMLRHPLTGSRRHDLPARPLAVVLEADGVPSAIYRERPAEVAPGIPLMPESWQVIIVLTGEEVPPDAMIYVGSVRVPHDGHEVAAHVLHVWARYG